MNNRLQRIILKKFLLVFLTMVFGIAQGQVICSNPITGQNPSIDNPYTNGQITAEHISATGIGIGTGIAGNAGTDKYTATLWTASASTVTTGEYFEFTITPDDGYKINFTGFAFSCQRSSTGPVSGVVRSSLDSFTSNLLSFGFTMVIAAQNVDLSGISFQNISDPITFRIYGYGSPANGGTGTASINDYAFNGNVLSECEMAAPAAVAQSFCNAATVGQLVPGGTDIKWYSVPNGGTALGSEVSLSNGNYYVSQTSEICESVRTEVAISIIVPEQPVGDVLQDFEEGEILSDLEVTGENLMWYADEAFTEPLPETTLLANSATYYVASISGECKSIPLAITANLVLGNAAFEMEKIICYPNPVKEILTVSAPEIIISIAVYNLLGQEIIETAPDTKNVKVNMADFPKAVYIVRITSGNRNKTVKIVRE